MPSRRTAPTNPAKRFHAGGGHRGVDPLIDEVTGRIDSFPMHLMPAVDGGALAEACRRSSASSVMVVAPEALGLRGPRILQRQVVFLLGARNPNAPAFVPEMAADSPIIVGTGNARKPFPCRGRSG